MTANTYYSKTKLIKAVNEQLKQRIGRAKGARKQLKENEAELKALKEKYPEYEI